MRIHLRSDWESKVSKSKACVYPLGAEYRAVGELAFGELERQGRIERTTKPTPFSYPVFVVWKDTPKGRRAEQSWTYVV